MNDVKIRWDQTSYDTSGRLADVIGGRLLVKRSRPRARTFDGKFNGRFLGCWPSRDEAMAAVERIYREGLL
jgi:hypothetical protein